MEASRDAHLTSLITYLLSYLLTDAMEHSPSWEANRFSVSHEIRRILWNPKVHHRTHKYQPPVPILSQHDPIHTATSHFLRIHLNIIFPRLGLPSGLFPSGFPTKTFYTPLLSPLHTCYMPRPSHSSRCYHPHNIGWAVRITSSSLCSFQHPCYLDLLRPKYSQHPILKHPQSTSIAQFERPSFTPIHNKRQNYSYVYLNP